MKKIVTLMTLTMLLLVACTFFEPEPEPAAEIEMPTPIGDEPQEIVQQPTVTATSQPASTQPPQPTAVPTLPPAPTSTLAPTTIPFASTTAYRVVHVTESDTLNVRSGPGVDNPVVGEFAPDAANVQITGTGVEISGSTWVPVTNGQVAGWVNGRFLTSPAITFCQDDAPRGLVQAVKTAVANRDEQLLATLVHPERGLRIRRYWWSEEFYFSQNEVRSLFTNPNPVEWGYQPGSGNPIVGSVNQVILPLLDADLAGGTELGCNELLEGGSANFVIIAPEHEGIDYYSSYRLGTELNGFLDWGTWALGIEQIEGSYYLSYLVHYEWEI